MLQNVHVMVVIITIIILKFVIYVHTTVSLVVTLPTVLLNVQKPDKPSHNVNVKPELTMLVFKNVKFVVINVLLV
jgi:hypothetical protein